MVYNRLVIIGNGFDLSQGLESSYKHFLLDYFKTAFNTVYSTTYYEDEFIFIEIDGLPITWPIKIAKYTKIEDYINDYNLKPVIRYKSSLFEKLVAGTNENWIDIEKFYYKQLKIINNELENEHTLGKVKHLNNFIENISKKLNDYLNKIQKEFEASEVECFNEDINYCFKNLRREDLEIIYRKNLASIDRVEIGKVLFLNFNYTKIIRLVLDKLTKRIPTETINIHGVLDDRSNPVIFGYGDDTSEDYKELELRDEDEFLKNIKSSKYSRTNNYSKTLNFLDENRYEIFVVGHSCGLSDKTLLRTIFEHENCLAIKIFHYKGYDEFMYKNIAISRHFSNKPIMREKVLPFDENARIVQRSNI